MTRNCNSFVLLLKIFSFYYIFCINFGILQAESREGHSCAAQFSCFDCTEIYHCRWFLIAGAVPNNICRDKKSSRPVDGYILLENDWTTQKNCPIFPSKSSASSTSSMEQKKTTTYNQEILLALEEPLASNPDTKDLDGKYRKRELQDLIAKDNEIQNMDAHIHQLPIFTSNNVAQKISKNAESLSPRPFKGPETMGLQMGPSGVDSLLKLVNMIKFYSSKNYSSQPAVVLNFFNNNHFYF